MTIVLLEYGYTTGVMPYEIVIRKNDSSYVMTKIFEDGSESVKVLTSKKNQ